MCVWSQTRQLTPWDVAFAEMLFGTFVAFPVWSRKMSGFRIIFLTYILSTKARPRLKHKCCVLLLSYVSLACAVFVMLLTSPRFPSDYYYLTDCAFTGRSTDLRRLKQSLHSSRWQCFFFFFLFLTKVCVCAHHAHWTALEPVLADFLYILQRNDLSGLHSPVPHQS